MSLSGRSPLAAGSLSCRQVGKLLQSYLDGAVESLTADKVAAHLEDCRRCGMAAEIYAQIKGALARQAPAVPADALARLRRFGDQLVAGPPPDEEDR